MAEVTARKRGSKWEYRFEMASIDGKRKQYSKSGFATKKEAMKAGTEAFAKYNKTGLSFEPSDISVADYLDYFFEQYCKTNLKYNSQVSYRYHITAHLKPAFGAYKLKNLQPSVITSWLNSLVLKGYSFNTIKHAKNCLSKALKYAVYPCQFIEHSPMVYVEMPKTTKKAKETKPVSYEDFNRILGRFPEGHRYHIALMLGWNLGVRIAEAMAITWDDINFFSNSVALANQAINRNYGNDVLKGKTKKWNFVKPGVIAEWALQPLKTESSVRTIPFGPTLRDFLLRERKRQEDNEREYGEFFFVQYLEEALDEKNNHFMMIRQCQKKDLPQDAERIFLINIAGNGCWTTPSSIRHCMYLIHHRLDIPDFDFHTLRHTHATNMIENNAELKAVQLRMGHKDIQTTYQIYVHCTKAMEEQNIEILEQINEKLAHEK